MAADISASSSFPIVPLDGGPKRTEGTQGNDQRVVQTRTGGTLGRTGEYPGAAPTPRLPGFTVTDQTSDGLGAAFINVEPDADDEPELDLGPASGSLVIEENEATGDFVYRIVDETTGDVLRQWPREELLHMSEVMEGLRGSVFDRKV